MTERHLDLSKRLKEIFPDKAPVPAWVIESRIPLFTDEDLKDPNFYIDPAIDPRKRINLPESKAL